MGEWSGRLDTDIRLEDGSSRNVFFRAKLIELSEDAEEFRLYLTSLCETTGWSDPPEAAEQIVSESGTFAPTAGFLPYTFGWFGLDTYLEINEQYTRFLGDAAAVLLKNHEWDLFFMHSHPPDWVYHAVMLEMDPDLNPNEDSRRTAWDTHLKIYQQQDDLLAQILGVLDGDDLVILVSDHGATPDGPNFNPFDALIPAGLARLQPRPEEKIQSDGRVHRKAKGFLKKKVAENIDWSTTRAVGMRPFYVYINLKGRDPDGIVEPEDYEAVQQEVIDALLGYVHPENGKRPVALALSKKDARILGLYGDSVGDVVYALYPWFGSQHGLILPTAEYGIGSLKVLFTMTGPGIKKGVHLNRTVRLTDLVPTVCYLMNLPVPADTEGAVIYQAFEDPNFRFHQET